MRLLALYAFLALSLLPATGARAERVTLVELFTSQGCSSCPPADALLAQIKGREGVLPLALHVDYWDYMGWEDAFARPEWTKRQEAYARARGDRSVYTPQMVVDGLIDVIGGEPVALMEAITYRRAQPAEIDFEPVSDTAIGLTARTDLSNVRVDLVHYKPSETVQISGGENIGKTVRYVNVVLDWQSLGAWSPETGDSKMWTLPPADTDTLHRALIVQSPQGGRVRGVFRLD